MSADDPRLADLAEQRLDHEIADDQWERLAAEHGDALARALADAAATRQALRALPRPSAPASLRDAILARTVAAPKAPAGGGRAWWLAAATLAAACLALGIALHPGDGTEAPAVGEATTTVTRTDEKTPAAFGDAGNRMKADEGAKENAAPAKPVARALAGAPPAPVAPAEQQQKREELSLRYDSAASKPSADTAAGASSERKRGAKSPSRAAASAEDSERDQAADRADDPVLAERRARQNDALAKDERVTEGAELLQREAGAKVADGADGAPPAQDELGAATGAAAVNAAESAVAAEASDLMLADAGSAESLAPARAEDAAAQRAQDAKTAKLQEQPDTAGKGGASERDQQAPVSPRVGYRAMGPGGPPAAVAPSAPAAAASSAPASAAAGAATEPPVAAPADAPQTTPASVASVAPLSAQLQLRIAGDTCAVTLANRGGTSVTLERGAISLVACDATGKALRSLPTGLPSERTQVDAGGTASVTVPLRREQLPAGTAALVASGGRWKSTPVALPAPARAEQQAASPPATQPAP